MVGWQEVAVHKREGRICIKEAGPTLSNLPAQSAGYNSAAHFLNAPRKKGDLVANARVAKFLPPAKQPKRTLSRRSRKKAALPPSSCSCAMLSSTTCKKQGSGRSIQDPEKSPNFQQHAVGGIGSCAMLG